MSRVVKQRQLTALLSGKFHEYVRSQFTIVKSCRRCGGPAPTNVILFIMTTVPLLDLKAQFAQIRGEVMPVIEQVCAGQHFILGEHVRALEEEIARYCGASAGIGVSSGTDALLLALMALDIGAGDEVITSPFTFFATAGTIARAGARPVFCDIDPATFNLSPAAVQAFIRYALLGQCRAGGQPRHRRPDQGADAGASLRSVGRHGPLHGHRPKVRLQGDRGCGPGHRHAPIRTANMPARSATLAAFHSFPARIWARSAMPACAPPTMPNWPSGCGYCGCMAASRSITTR